MCILFIFSGDDTPNSRYKLILASNRDEFFERPAAVATRWEEDREIIGGRDMEPGREGGTWLAASPARKKIAALLNLPGAPTPENALGRGSIVADFLSNNHTVEEYTESINNKREPYGPFNLVTVEIDSPRNKVTFYSNFDKERRYYNDNIISFGNSLPECPLKKTLAGKERFNQIVSRHISNDTKKDALIDELLSLLKWEEQHLPDPELKRRRPHSPDQLAAVFVNVPSIKYGTRTHTVILIDSKGHMDFLESTKIPNQSEWQQTHIEATVAI